MARPEIAEDLRDDKPLWGLGEVLRMAAPTAANMVNVTIMQFIDGLMVSKLIGARALAAQYVSNIFAFVPTAFAMGVLTTTNTFVSQNLGAGRLRRCGQYAWTGVYLAAVMSAAMVALVLAAPRLFVLSAGILGQTGGKPPGPEEMAMQITYYRYMVGGACVLLVARVLGQYFYGTHRPMVVFLTSLVAVVVNIVLNYVLITGWWVFPALGLTGAAIATVIGWGVSLGLMFALFLRRGEEEKFRTRSGWRPRARFAADLLRIGWPAGVQFAGDIFSWAVFITFLVGYFGEVHRAASAAVMRYVHVSFMPAVGISIACTAVVGRYIGLGRPDLARKRLHAGVLLAVAYMGACGLTFWLLRQPLVGFFVGEHAGDTHAALNRARVVEIGATVMMCAAVFQAFDAVGIVFIGGLRGAGDTFWPMMAMLVLAATVLVGGGIAVVRFLPHLLSLGPWITASAYVILLGLAIAWRFETGRWKRIDLLRRRASV